MAHRSRAYVGTSGWSYDDWQGRFYPEGTSAGERLAFLASVFDTVEVNHSFYQIPDRDAVASWAEGTPDRFRFAFKLWRGITHYKKLQDCAEHLQRFFAPLEVLPVARRGPVLVQTPPQLRLDTGRLEAFLDLVRQTTAPQRWKVAVEFRHPSWICDEAYEVLERQSAAVCLHDMRDAAPTTEPTDSSFVYLRRHGPSSSYTGGYDDDAVAEDARRVRSWLDEGRTVYAYYNNDVGGHAARDARRLLERLGMAPATEEGAAAVANTT